MLDTLPLVFILAGLVFYTVLAGADFGAGVWRLLAPGGPRGDAIRDLAHHSMGPVWEANHVWLIFVLTVSWTAYPTFLGSVASTLGVALFIAGFGIILRGASYALRAGAREREMRAIDSVLGVASLIAPFALGAAAGAIASERVPVGNAAGHLFSSWLNPTSALTGILAVTFCAYLAAVYLAADAERHGKPELVEALRRRALGAGAAAGALAVAGLFVLHGDAHGLYTGLLHGAALVAVIVSVLSGVVIVGLVWARRFELARYGVAVPIAALIGGWALARYPTLLPGLSVHRAAAPHDALVCLVVAVLAGGAILFPSLGLLFRLFLRGHLEAGGGEGERGGPGATPAAGALAGQLLGPGLGARLAAALLIAGVGLLNAADASWAHALGVVSLFAFMIVAFATIVPRALADDG
jgi:cytochrome d ubiquinol oxidase subunit II